MVTLKNFLNENDVDIAQLNFNLHKYCQPYLKLIRNNFPLYRGMEKFQYDDTGKNRVRKDRLPQGMFRDTAIFLNKWLQRNGHARRDKSVICTSSKSDAAGFGDPYWIWPIGNFKYSWMETKDANLDDARTGWTGYTIDAWRAERENSDIDAIDDILGKLKKPFEEHFHTNKGFKVGYANGYEFWFECKEYFYCYSRYADWDVKEQTLTKK